MAATDEFVTRDELAVRLAELELRIVDRIAALERRMDDRFSRIDERFSQFEERMNDHFKTQTRWIVGLYAAVAVAALIIARMPRG